MKNNHGQVLVLFICLFPFLLLLLGFIIELSYVAYQKNHIISTTKSIMKACASKCSDEEITSLFQKNNIKYETLEIINEEEIEIKLKTKIESFLGKLIVKEGYSFDINYKGYFDKEKLIIVRG